MKIDRPLWAAGALLSPQQFQQQARWEAWANESVAHLSLVHPWGVQGVAFDLQALRLGKLKATHVRVRMPDGTLVDTDHADRLPPALELARLLPDDAQETTLLLALPLEQANGNNCVLDGTRADRPTRYRQDWRQVQDVYADEVQSMGVLEYVLTLRLADDENAVYLTCPVARLVRDGQGAWNLDSDYVPPLLSFAAHPGLLTQLDNLLTQLSAKRQRLMGMRRESNQRMADFAVADVSLFWLLNALNTYQPVLADLKAHPARHPEQVYLELIKLAGSLLTFSLEQDLDCIPAYRHEQLESVFPPLMRTISTLLEASLPSRVIALELEEVGANRWQVTLNDARLRERDGADFYLSVRCRMPAAQLQSQFPRLCKVGTPDDVNHLVNAALDGVPLQPLSHVPAAIPLRLENQYFALDLGHATLIGAGNQAGGADAANLLKPALARGELRTIAATTWSEYKQYFERDAALERRFQMVKVDEPDDANASLMLRGLKARYASHHGVHILDAAVQAAVNLSRRYLTGRQLPDKAVDLLDTASARVRMSLDCEPQPLVRLKARQTALELERQALKEDQQLSGSPADERLAIIAAQHTELNHQQLELEEQYRHELDLTQQLLDARQAEPPRMDACRHLQQQLSDAQGNQPLLSLDVNARSVAEVIADWTGVPLGSLLKDEQANLLELEQQLGEQVIGQDHALCALAQRLRAAKTGLTDEKAPLGVFLLVGTSGVGKTETALALADKLFGGEKSLITINLSEYQEAHTVSQLKGSPPGYVGYGQGGVLTEAVRQRPYSVVLLDEVEKAHRDVLNLFYQVFDRGCMRDGEGREIDFRNTVILMTSNLGSDELQACLQEFPGAPDSTLHELLRPILREHFQPALLARFQTLIYRPLQADALKRIVAIKLAQVAKRLQRHYGLTCQIDAALNEALVAACLLPDTGARNIDSLLNQQILPVLSQQLLQRQAAQQKTLGVTLGYSDEEGIVLHFTDAQGTASPVAMEA